MRYASYRALARDETEVGAMLAAIRTFAETERDPALDVIPTNDPWSFALRRPVNPVDPEGAVIFVRGERFPSPHVVGHRDGSFAFAVACVPLEPESEDNILAYFAILALYRACPSPIWHRVVDSPVSDERDLLLVFSELGQVGPPNEVGDIVAGEFEAGNLGPHGK